MPEDTDRPPLGPPLNFRETKSQIDKIRNKEQELAAKGMPMESNIWGRYEGKVDEYDRSFSEILDALGFESLRDWMKQRKESGLTTHILDVMGGNGAFLRDASIDRKNIAGYLINPYYDKSLVITLVDETLNREWYQENNAKRGISIIAGNITSGGTWQAVAQWLESQEIPAFDLVVCRGIGGIDYIPTPLYKILLEKFYRITTNKEGVILSQIDRNLDDQQIDGWCTALGLIPGIRVFARHRKNTFDPEVGAYGPLAEEYPAIGLVRGDGSPDSLKPYIRDLK